MKTLTRMQGRTVLQFASHDSREAGAGSGALLDRAFLRLVSAAVYDGTSWHRVGKGFVVQTGHMPTRTQPLSEAQQRLVRNLKAEFNDQVHELDQEYTVFGRVVSGIDVVQQIEGAANGETPVERIELTRVRLVKR